MIPVILSSFTVTPSANNNLLNWTVEEASQLTTFDVQLSFDGYTFRNIGTVPFVSSKSLFNYIDVAYPGKTVFYRLVIHERSGRNIYSSIVKVNNKSNGINITAQVSSQNILIKLENFAKGKYQPGIINTAGSLVAKKSVTLNSNGNSNIIITLQNELSHGVYYAVIRDKDGMIVAATSFYY